MESGKGPGKVEQNAAIAPIRATHRSDWRGFGLWQHRQNGRQHMAAQRRIASLATATAGCLEAVRYDFISSALNAKLQFADGADHR